MNHQLLFMAHVGEDSQLPMMMKPAILKQQKGKKNRFVPQEIPDVE